MTEVKILTQPETGQIFKLGRNKPVAVGPHLRLGNYMLRSLPAPPVAVSYITPARQFLTDILGNDRNGDCTIAAAFHVSGALILNAQSTLPLQYNSATAVALYYQLTGGQDTGLDEQVVFNWWQEHGLLAGVHKIEARVSVNPHDQVEVETALWLFENIYLTAELPDEWISPMPNGSGFVWDAAGDPNPDNGHAFCGVAYDAAGITIDTWGLFGNLTWTALAKYCNKTNGGGCYSVLSQDIFNISSAKAPNGFDFSQLGADVASFRVP